MALQTILRENYVMLDPLMTVAQMLGKLKLSEKAAGIVFKDKQYLGLVEKRQLLRSDADLHTVAIEKFVLHKPIVAVDTSFEEVARLLYTSSSVWLPVERDKQIVGVVHAFDVLKALAQGSYGDLVVGDCALSAVSIVPQEAISSAVALMRTHHLEDLPVIDQGEVLGVLNFKDVVRASMNWSSRRDVSGKFNAQQGTKAARVEMERIGDFPVESYYTKNVRMIRPTTAVRDALELMDATSTLPVVDEQFIGLLTLRSLLKAACPVTPKNYQVQFVGLKDVALTEHQRMRLREITEQHAQKIRSATPVLVKVHVKAVRQTGSRQMYEVHLKVEQDGRVDATHKEDWDLETALHKCFKMV